MQIFQGIILSSKGTYREMFVLVWLNFQDFNYLAGFHRTFLFKLVNTKLYSIKLWR